MIQTYDLPKELIPIVEWACGELFIDDVHIIFEFDCTLFSETGCHGSIQMLEDDEYLIYLDDHISGFELFTTIFHELMHLHQFLWGEYESYNKWYGEDLIVSDNVYHDLPWEMEAFSMENILYDQYMKEAA
jgi:hypothetical protein